MDKLTNSFLFYALNTLICFTILVCGASYLHFNRVLSYSNNYGDIDMITNYQAEIIVNNLTKLHAKSFDGSTHVMKNPTINHVTTVDIQTSVKDMLSKHKPSHGYVLAYEIFEQQTAAAQNLWGLQYWANTVNMKVVEPFIGTHTMSFEPVVMGTRNPMRFSDLYDREFWNNQSMIRHCSKLVEWEEFLQNAPKQTILAFVYNNYGRSPTNVSNHEAVTNPNSIMGKQVCNYTSITFPETALRYFRKLKFQFIRKVCIHMHNPIEITELSRHILSQYNSSNVTIIFPGWAGIRRNKINVKGVSFNGANTVSIGLLPSKQIVEDSEKYLKRIIPNGGKYFGVMVRTENIYTRTVNQESLIMIFFLSMY